MESFDAIVIGGGISGLTAAYQCCKKGLRTALVESARPGGVVETSCKEGFTLEHGPNVLMEKPSLTSLIAELGLASDVVYPSHDKYLQCVWHGNKPIVVPKSPPALLTTPALNLLDKVMLPGRVFKRRIVPAGADDMSIAELFERIAGKRAVTFLIDPVLKGIYGGDVEKLSARSIFPVLWERLAAGGSLFSYVNSKKGAPRPRIFVLRRGMNSLIEALQKKTPSAAKYSARAISLASHDSGFAVTCEGLGSVFSKRVFIATSGKDSSEFLRELEPELAARLAGLAYAPLAVLHFAVSKPCAVPERAFGVLFPSVSRSSILGVMFNSELFPHLAPEGRHLLTVCMGGAGNEQLLALEPEELEKLARTELAGKLSLRDTDMLALRKWPRAIPQYQLGHYKITAMMHGLEERYPGLRFVGADRDGVGVPDRVKAAYWEGD